MSHILIKFLINILFISFIQSNAFESWLNGINSSISSSQPIELSMRLESYGVGNSNEMVMDDKFYLRFYPLDNTYQIKYLNNIIYYDGENILQLNRDNNQLFKFLPDQKIKNFLNQKMLNQLFNFNNYICDDKINEYKCDFGNSIEDLDGKISIYGAGNLIDVLYLDEIYSLRFNALSFSEIDFEIYQRELLTNYYKKDKNIEIFDFTK